MLSHHIVILYIIRVGGTGARVGALWQPRFLAALEAKPFLSRGKPCLYASKNFAPFHGTIPTKIDFEEIRRKLNFFSLHWKSNLFLQKAKHFFAPARLLHLPSALCYFLTQCRRKLSSKKADLLQ
jgi:hypothetical protein